MPGQRRPRSSGRVDYAEAGKAARAVLLAANGAGLTARQLRTLNAVMAHTALYSRVEDRVYLAQLAAFSYGVQHAEPWMLKKVREDLAALRDRVPIVTAPPRGRPPLGHEGPAYRIALDPPESVPDPGVHLSAESVPDPGPEVTPDPVRNAPRSRTEMHPEIGGEMHPEIGPPTEKVSEEPSEEDRQATRSAPHRLNGNVRPLARRLAASTTAPAEMQTEAERVVELLLAHGLTVDDVEAKIASLDEPAADAFSIVLAEPHADDTILADPAYRVLLDEGVALAIVDATRGDWRAHAADAVRVGAHLEEATPGALLADLEALIRAARLESPWRALGVARPWLEERGIVVPRLERHDHRETA